VFITAPSALILTVSTAVSPTLSVLLEDSRYTDAALALNGSNADIAIIVSILYFIFFI
jgi:hypothetical protein